MGDILTLANFIPASNAQSESAMLDTRWFQVIVHERKTVILGTKTGRFLVNPSYLGKPRWVPGDFELI